MESGLAAARVRGAAGLLSGAWSLMLTWPDSLGGLKAGTLMVRASSQTAVRGFWRPPVPAGGRRYDDVPATAGLRQAAARSIVPT
jgi:hypothetical protein